MPIYDYECKNCKGGFTQMFSSYRQAEEAKEKSAIACPSCASKDVEKLMSTKTSFQLKGSGWARDRYKGKK